MEKIAALTCMLAMLLALIVEGQAYFGHSVRSALGSAKASSTFRQS